MSPRPLPHPPAVWGVLNVTPDSFSHGGESLEPEAACARAVEMVAEGASVVDVGAESTRPGAEPVTPEQEQARLLPVLRLLRRAVDVPLSIDTRHASTARAALDLGADIVNDVSMLRHDPDLARVVAQADAGLVLMHSRGTPQDMQREPRYADVAAEVVAELRAAVIKALASGCSPDRMVVDPGLGFGKTLGHNLALLADLPRLRTLGYPVLVGASRKAFVGTLLGGEEGPRPVAGRAHGSVGAALAARVRGADHLRVHDVRETVDALRVFEACQGR